MRSRILVICWLLQPFFISLTAQDEFVGKHYRGKGDTEYLELLEKARRFFDPDPALPNMSMLYSSALNSMVEGPTWDAWWIQNSYGTTWCALPFFQEPYLTFLQNAQDFWFDQMGDGVRKGANDWQAPDGCLCDCARPGWIMYKQGDGKIDIHDWGVGFTAAGLLMQSELLLISRDKMAIDHYLPMLERSANFVDSRRDPANNLYLAGPAGNLLAPSFAGWLRPDGTYGHAYLAELSVTFIAALNRLIELEKLAGRKTEVKHYSGIRDLARKGLPLLMTPDGYFLRSIDPDGTLHGVFGAPKHGYFETTPNHDAIAFRVVDDNQANTIYSKMASIPQLRPFKLIIPNYPAYDDMYERETGIWKYGTWINGGHWSTCEGRMMMAYSRLGKYEDMRQSMKQILSFADNFRMDNPLTKFGSDVYQPNQPYNVTYDAFAIPAALIRGLFEYLYQADRLTLIPHIPGGITELHQLDPIRFGEKKLWLSVKGSGEITAVEINGKRWKSYDKTSVFLPYDQLPENASIMILSANAGADHQMEVPSLPQTTVTMDFLQSARDTSADFGELQQRMVRQFEYYNRLTAGGQGETYHAAHARLTFESFAAAFTRRKLLEEGNLQPLPRLSQEAVDRLYMKTAETLCEGSENAMQLMSDTIRMTDFGLDADSRINAVPFVQKALEACREKASAVLYFPKGRYDFWPDHCIEKVYYESNTTVNNPRTCAVLLEGLTDVTLDCGGSDFVFHGRMQPFTIDKSTGITIKKVSIDWDIPLTAEAEVIGVNDGYVDIRVDPAESPYMIDKGKLVFVGEGWKSQWWGTMEFDRETRVVAYKTGDWGCLGAGWNSYKAEELSPGLIRLNFAFTRLPATGNYLVLRHSERDHAGIFITDSRNTVVEDLNMYHNAGLGILSQYSQTLTFRRVNSVPNPVKNRILAGHDDGLHFSNCAGQIAIDQCRFHALMDDPVNVHGTSVRIMEKVDANTLICKFMHGQSIGMIWARHGESIGFIENNSLLTIAHGTVDWFEAIQPELFKIRFKEAVPAAIKEGYALENLSWTPDVLITGSRFESCRARGILISTPGKVVIENNLFESSGSAILIAGDANNWYESGGVKDVLIRNNHFTDQCLTSMYQFCEAVISIYPEIPKPDPSNPGFHRNIRIENNQFDLFDYPVLYARSVDNLTFTGNKLNSSQRFQPWHPRKFSVSLEFCKGVIINNNLIDPRVHGRNIHIGGMKKKELQMGKGQFFIEILKSGNIIN